MKCTSLAFRDRGNSFVLGITENYFGLESGTHSPVLLFPLVLGSLWKGAVSYRKESFVLSAHSFNVPLQTPSRQCPLVPWPQGWLQRMSLLWAVPHPEIQLGIPHLGILGTRWVAEQQWARS